MEQRLIDLDVLLEELEKNRPVSALEILEDRFFDSGFDSAENIVKEQTVVDPVKHGKWEYDEDVKALYCGNCGVFAQPQRKTAYCPHCGARMDGE